MSQYEHRIELWSTAQETIDAAEENLRALNERLSGQQPSDVVATLAQFSADFALEVDSSITADESAFIARARHFNAEDMRKGLQHGHVAVVACGDAARSTDLVAAAATAIGLAATLVKMYGQVSFLVVERTQDLVALAENEVFTEPDCVLTFRASNDGQGFQHTITSSGNHLAGASVELTFTDGSGTELHELQNAIRAIFDDLGEAETIQNTSSGFEIRAPRGSRVEEIRSQIEALVRTRAESEGSVVDIQQGQLLVEMLPSHILARRIKTFADTLKAQQDRVQKQSPGEPTYWGPVSHEVATAFIGYPVPDNAAQQAAAIDTALGVAKAACGAGLDLFGDMEFRGFVEGERIRALRERNIARTPRRWLGVHPVQPPADGQRKPINLPDVVVRGPGLRPPTLDDFVDDESS